MSNQAEQERINHVYRQWHGGAALDRYAWHRPEIVRQAAARARVLAALLPATVGRDLSAVRAIDIGCGNGAFLRQLIDWGALPAHLAGTELQPDRLEHAHAHTAPGVRWHLGQLDDFADASVDLVSAHTVFSSILDEDLRRALAAQMWRVLRPGGWTMIFDFRYDNPRNPNVRKVSDVELLRFWPTETRHYRTLVLAPPLGRVLARLPRLLPELLETLVPPLRSHFVYMAKKE
ncbi:class I SAM-dependent methyltransferase [Massilia forsythiae]|uniref:Class I SAM-dependent methyltransferase n=1 Tax=Massilia forsythiae TaxID=2728020 RepID=A0A7Z2ZRE7_9BURK|nr:class I SAM-dependent methyltransferase [Massilia forsythiae]QJD99397.1 class I SAM-dependent methyltransferase [Massilia forsythiae]